MSRDLISKATRRAFQEHLVGWTLRTITSLFDDHDISLGTPPEDFQMPAGERRSLVAMYYFSVNWTSGPSVRRVLDAYAEVLGQIPAPGVAVGDYQNQIAKLIGHLQRDGYEYSQGRLSRSSDVGVGAEDVITATSTIDLQHLEGHIQRIKRGVGDDPELAIGSAKDLLEATLRTILTEAKQAPGHSEDIPSLLKNVQKLLALAPSDVADTKKGADSIKRVLSGLNSCVIGIAELRSLYGTGHGRAKRSGIAVRHARLAGGACTTLCTFLLETWDDRLTRTS